MIGGLFKQTAISDLQHPTAWLLGAFNGGRKTASGATVTGSTVLTLPVYWACIRNLSEDIASLPLHTYRQEGASKVKATDNPLYGLLHDAPNPEMTAMAFRETMMMWALGWRAGFAEIERNGADVTGLWPIHPSRVRSVRDETGELFWRVRGSYSDDSGVRHEADVDIPDSDMFVLHGLGNDGINGYSVIELAAESIGLGLALQTYAANFFGGSTAVQAVLKSNGPQPKQDILDRLSADWQERYSGPDAGRKPAILPPGWDFSRMDVNPEEAQAIESRKFQVEDIARVLRMPLSKINAGAAAAGEREAIDYVVDTITPWLTRWEQEANRKLVRPSERATLYVRHSVQGRLRGDHASRGSYYQTMRSIGVLSINDILELEERDSIGPDGDIRFVPMNTIPLSSAGAFAEAQITKSMAAPQTTQRNPTDEGGGANNAPKEDSGTRQAAPDYSVIAMGFLSPITQRLAVKEARELEKRGKQSVKDFTAWAEGTWYTGLAGEASECLASPLSAYARLTGRTEKPDVAAWYDTSRRLAIEAYKSGTVASRVAALETSVGGDMARMLVEGKQQLRFTNGEGNK